MDEDKYLNFPITLLRNAYLDTPGMMTDIMNYAAYVHTLKLSDGDVEQKINAAGRYLGIRYGNPSSVYNSGSCMFRETPKGTPFTGINKNLCFEFRDNYKSPFEITVLLAFLALKSIIGDKPYISMTNAFLLARMCGYTSVSDVPNPLPEPLAKYNTRRKLDSVKQELRLNWHVNIYGYRLKGFYVSFDNKCTYQKLVDYAEGNRKKAIESKLHKQQNEARNRALAALYFEN